MRVPVYDAPQVEARPLPGVRQDSVASPSLLNAPAAAMERGGKQLVAAGQDIAKIAGNMADRENADALFRAENAIKTEYIAFEQQARESRRGAAAKDLTKDAADWWDRQGATHADNLSNPVQKRLFSQQVAKLRTQSMDGMSAYEAEQRRISLGESASASIASSINMAASQVNTPTERPAIMGAKDDINKRIDILAKVNGWSPEMVEAKRAESLTNLHMQVLQNMVNSDPSRAKAYFEANKAEINGANHDAIQALYKTGAAKEKAQKTSDELTNKGVSEAEGLAWIRSNLKGEEQEQASLEWKTRHAEITQARERTQRDAADQAYGIYARTGRFSAIPADVLNKLDGRVLLALKKDAQGAAEGKMPKTDWDKYYALRANMKADPRKYAMGSYDLRGDFSYLGAPERKELMKLQEDLADPEKISELQNVDGQISATLKPLGLKPADAAQAENAIRGAIDAEAKNRGAKLKPEERQKVIDRMVIDGEVLSGKWYMNDPNKRYYQLTPAERKAFKARIPDAQSKQIIEALRAKGRPVTDEAIIDLYNETKRRGGIK